MTPACCADKALKSADKALCPTTKGTRSKRARSVKTWMGEDDNDENNAQAANTPVIQPTTIKKLRIMAPTPDAGKSTVKREAGRSTVKKELGKSAFKKEIERFALVCLSAEPCLLCGCMSDSVLCAFVGAEGKPVCMYSGLGTCRLANWLTGSKCVLPPLCIVLPADAAATFMLLSCIDTCDAAH